MAEQFASKRNLKFMLDEVLDVNSLTRYDFFADHSPETFDMIINTAWKMGTELMYPQYQDMDKNPPRYENGQAQVHPVVRTFLDECGSGGWLGSTWPYELRGQQLPHVIKSVYSFLWPAANFSLSVYSLLNEGAANLLKEFASQELKDLYLEKLLSCEWQGTMAMTEPGAGSSLSDIVTMAEKDDNDDYRIKGQKIFISCADTNAVENTVHMTLVKIKGAPAGVRGISLFLIPKYRVNANGEMEFNDVVCDGIEHKLGYRGAPACQLTFGGNKGCIGYLVGEAGKGLAYMFQMMNEERINIGIAAAGKATAAYYAALEFAQQRLQGRKPSEKDPSSPMIPIIEHADVKRMLLMQKAVCEGSLSLALLTSKYQDLANVAENDADKEKYNLLVDLLVPLVKNYASEMGVLSTSAAMQCMGGYGYCSDFPVEQYFRDMRINPIHEGTTLVQAEDLLGRKVSMKKGKAFNLFINEVKQAIQDASSEPQLQSLAQELEQNLILLQDVTRHLQTIAAQGKLEEFLADAVLYLDMFGFITIAWQWLMQATVAQKALAQDPIKSDKVFYKGKIYTCRYYFAYELSKTASLAKRLLSTDGLTVELPSAYLV